MRLSEVQCMEIMMPRKYWFCAVSEIMCLQTIQPEEFLLKFITNTPRFLWRNLKILKELISPLK